MKTISTTENDSNISEFDALEKIKKNLIDNSLLSENEVKVTDQKLEIFNLISYSGKYFNNKINSCFIRTFNRTPNLVFVTCEYTFDTKATEAKKVETYLKKLLTKLGFNPIKVD